MPVYVQFVTWTEKGAVAARDTVARTQQAREAAERFGARLREVIWTMGRFDVVAIIEAPNDETASRFALWVGTQGAARTETVRGYTEEEIRRIVEGL
ncbi:MAG: GYD domain-containing protein [Armatimonadota bacterium]|nr:GYD domain-containing protein [Armatimonadota bacterium]MDR7427727.1 GYD domain-containing protein [Armatimonadota bacterium]MDR7469638.1 GYD domain-containing protein [Armatimonadota bacterium]MDR7474931.1 GYD domain-containing protein [Armatimonadota bacterium]MDR7538357.1 GYD domain-containing protein [Armatimonadota bacterium]